MLLALRVGGNFIQGPKSQGLFLLLDLEGVLVAHVCAHGTELELSQVLDVSFLFIEGLGHQFLLELPVRKAVLIQMLNFARLLALRGLRHLLLQLLDVYALV